MFDKIIRSVRLIDLIDLIDLEKTCLYRQIRLKSLCLFEEHVDPPGKYVSNRETPTPLILKSRHPNRETPTPQSRNSDTPNIEIATPQY